MYAKVFNQIFDSSIADDLMLRYFFTDMLTLADQNGVVDMTASAIAARTRVPLADVQKHLNTLEQPDPESRTKENEGRRIVRLDEHRSWGWIIVNYDRFRRTASEEQRREKNLACVKKYREKTNKQPSVTQPSLPVIARHGPSSLSCQAEAEAEAEGKATKTKTLAALAESIYDVYPKKVGRLIALQAIEKALKTTSHETLLATTVAYAAARAGQDSQYTPNPATWFNEARYQDDPAAWSPAPKVRRKESNEREENLTLKIQ